MATTASGLWYPGLGDPPNGPAQIQQAQESVDEVYGKSVATWAALLALTGNYKGRRVFVDSLAGVAVYNGTKWLAPKYTLLKAADETRTSNATLTNDNHFLHDVPQAGTYLYEWTLYLLCASGVAGDSQFGMSFGSVTAVDLGGFGADIGLAGGTLVGSGNWQQLRGITSGTSNLKYGTTSNGTLAVRLSATVVALAAQTVRLMWAQNTSDANVLTMFARSKMTVENVA